MIALALTGLAALLNIWATVAVYRSNIASGLPRFAWLVLVWVLPLLGAILAFQISKESVVVTKAQSSIDSGPDMVSPPGTSGTDIAGQASFHHGA
jgi:phospholipase D-like protein